MTTRQKFWLKVVLAVTFPVWIFAVIVAAFVAIPVMIVWEMVSDLVEPRTGGYWDGPL